MFVSHGNINLKDGEYEDTKGSSLPTCSLAGCSQPLGKVSFLKMGRGEVLVTSQREGKVQGNSPFV